MKLFITAIGTDCGKTVVSSILCQALKAAYWKPVQTGTIRDADIVKGLVNYPITIFPETHHLSEPASPHFAAAKENTTIFLDNFYLPSTNEHLIIEGAGGILVPLNDKGEYLIDFIKKENIELVVVIKLYLGCINHALLTLYELKRRGLQISGLVFNGIDRYGAINFIREHTNLPILFQLTEEPLIDKAIILHYAQKLQLK